MAEITKTTPERPFKVPNYVWLMFAALTLAAYFCGLNLPLVGPDEPRYAQVAREMWQAGDWITPTLGGHAWFEKPPLLYWMQMAAYQLFGVTEFAARLGSAMCGLGTIVSIWLLARLSNPDEGRVTTQMPNWLALVAASTFGILVFAHGASFDIVITFTLTASLVSFLLFDRRNKGETLCLLFFYLFIGLSLLAKGLIGVLFPFAIVALYYTVSRRTPPRIFLKSLLWGIPLLVAVAAVWYVPAYVRNGWPFVDEFIIQHHFQRFASNKYQHPQPFYFFFWVLPLMTLPWVPFAVGGVRGLLGSTKTVVAEVRPLRLNSTLAFSICWIAVPLVFFSLSGSKLPGYILPAVPGAILLAGHAVSSARKVWKVTALCIAGAVLAGTVVLVFTVVPRFADKESVRPLIGAANARGFSNDRVFAVHTTPHGTEFYAPGRILRGSDGQQKKLYSGPELKTEMERAGVSRSLVIVHAAYPDDLTAYKNLFRYEKLAENGELAIYSVELLGGPPQTVH